MDDREVETHDAASLARTLERVHDADIADALNAIDPPAAARVLAALPFDLAVRALNQPAHVFRRLPARVATRLLAAVDTSTKESLHSLLSYPPTTAGGIMTTEHV